jgi:hypothetical protein
MEKKMEAMENAGENLIPEEGTYGLQYVEGDAVALWIRYNGSDEDIKRLLWSFACGVRNGNDGSVYDREPFDPAQCATVKDAGRLPAF